MKLIGFVCALALMGAVGCGDDSDGNTGGSGGSTGGSGGSAATGGTGGGTGGMGGTGAISTDACLNAEDTAVFEAATYTNAGNETFTGDDAVAEVGGDCVLGSPSLVSNGCGAETGAALANPTDENIGALVTCVEVCIAEQGFDLTAECMSCYGASVSCGAAFCTGPCASDVNAPACIECRCGGNAADANCFGDFDVCSGLVRDPDPCAAP